MILRLETTGNNGRMQSIDSLPSLGNGGETPNALYGEDSGFSAHQGQQQHQHQRTHSGKKKKAIINPKK